jgi:S1-C subfamily serine protease
MRREGRALVWAAAIVGGFVLAAIFAGALVLDEPDGSGGTTASGEERYGFPAVEPGDIVVAIDGRAVASRADIRWIPDHLGPERPSEVVIERKGRRITLRPGSRSP